jgi:hypothetical protein
MICQTVKLDLSFNYLYVVSIYTSVKMHIAVHVPHIHQRIIHICVAAYVHVPHIQVYKTYIHVATYVHVPHIHQRIIHICVAALCTWTTYTGVQDIYTCSYPRTCTTYTGVQDIYTCSCLCTWTTYIQVYKTYIHVATHVHVPHIYRCTRHIYM